MLDLSVVFNADMLYVLSQIFALVGTILSLMSMQQKKKVQILNINALASSAAVLHYLFLGAWPGLIAKLIGTIRNITAAYEAHNHKTSKILAVVFVLFYVVSGILTFESGFSLLPMIGPSIFTIAIYLGDAKKIRYAAGFASLLWLIYNIHVLSVVGIISEVVYIVNDLVAIWRYRKRRERQHKTKTTN